MCFLTVVNLSVCFFHEDTDKAVIFHLNHFGSLLYLLNDVAHVFQIVVIAVDEVSFIIKEYIGVSAALDCVI